MNENDFDAIVLLSGGLDSVVSVSYIINKLNYNNIFALFFDYGQNTAKQELNAAKNICRFYNIVLKEIKLDFLSELTEKKPAPCINEIELDNVELCLNTAKSVWVPNRNALFLNIAASYCDKYNIKNIVIGINKEEGQTFSDNKVEFIDIQNKVFEYSTQCHPKIIAPMANYTKEQIVETGLSLNVPLKFIFSCYNSKSQKHCGKCESCKRLMRALKSNNQESIINQIFD